MSDVTSCIALTDDGDKVDADSPLKEPLKKKGANIHNPYPNFKVLKMICKIIGIYFAHHVCRSSMTRAGGKRRQGAKRVLRVKSETGVGLIRLTTMR